MSAQQNLSVSGVVTDAADGSPLIGVSVKVKGTNTGTLTDVNGHYAINAAQGSTLVFSYIGMEKQEISAKSNVINLKMKSDAKVLDEVVAIGYGTAKKKDLTGSVGSISGEKLRESIVTNADQMLQGKVAGVQVSQNSGAPGAATSIRVRGATSVNGSNEPLYIIDGIPVAGSGTDIGGFSWSGGSNGQSKVNPLSTISPSDIVSMDILKDASACAIYGAAGANGVVIVNTKRGKEGRVNVSYDGYYAIQTFAKKIDMMNLREYAQYQKDLYDLGASYTLNDAYKDPSLLGSGTDWQNEVTRNAPMQSHQLSLTGGNKTTQFSFSGGYMKQEGTIIGSDFTRFSSRSNLDHEFSKWLKLGGTLSYARTNETIINNDGINGILLQSLMMQPDVPVYDFDGNYAGPTTTQGSSLYNPVATALRQNNTLLRDRIMGGFYAQINLGKHLNVRSEYNFDGTNSVNKGFKPTYTYGVLQNNTNTIYQREDHSFFWMVKNYATYDQTFAGDHHVTVMVGMETSKSAWEGISLQKKGLSTNDIHVITADGDYYTNSGWKDEASKASVFGRANYTYADKYLVTATVRRDGSSKFGDNNKWGLFPSVAAAWRVNNESFLKDFKELTNLKFRLGYGQVGNDNIGTYKYGSTMRAVSTADGTSYRMVNFSNPNLKWEASEQYNLGLDMGWFNSRIDLSVELYNKSTKDMLLQPSVVSAVGGSTYDDIATPYSNIGKVTNKGVDIALNTVNIVKKNFQWKTNIVFSKNKNKVTALDKLNTPIYGKLDWYSEFQTATLITVNQPMGVFYGYKTDGYFENEDAIKNGPVQVDDGTGNNKIDKNSGVWVGDIRFKDLNGDGKITAADQTTIGDPNPDFTYGMTNTFNYKNWELGVSISGQYGGDILNYVRVKTEGVVSQWDNQAKTVATNRVTYGYYDGNSSNKDVSNLYISNAGSATIPRWSTTDVNRNNRMSDRWLEDASYLRISNISLAYVFPSRWMSKFSVSNLKVYLNLQNVYTFTNYSGYDPEVGSYNQSVNLQNIDMGRYPSPRVYTLGVNLTF